MLGFLLWALAGGTTIPSNVSADIAETRQVAALGDAFWPGYSAAPFSFLLIEDDSEYLLCDPRSPGGFAGIGVDPLTGCEVKQGPRSWRPPSLLAAMPLFGEGEVIVMGSPEDTGLTRQAWRRTILHEHFHQWQGQLPAHYDRTAALDLADGDTSGMWMIQYSFPYADPAVGEAYRAAADALLFALRVPDADLPAATSAYLARRKAFAGAAGARNWRYFDFQLWKEGVARWTEIAIARRAGGAWETEAEAYWAQQLRALENDSLADQGRIAVYAYGAAEAALLERVDPDWRGCYRAVLQLGDCWASLALADMGDGRNLHAP